ncbi:hypothetical protein [Vibrio cyclitrophicus]|uniref:hypothetical protein n=1 Tax=Vibrio cyclitrophicus TaxID=47951 RepID=UPI0011B45AEF|nr:hypothetical protein [Vibrio cyclitrophicus]
MYSFSERFDNDEKLSSKAKPLTIASAILVALEVTGATMKEANTFLFKIEFTNQAGIGYLLLCSILYLSIRYFNYAQPYHQQLFLLWSERMLGDRKVFGYDPTEEVVTGLLGCSIQVWGGDEPGIQASRYHNDGFLKRSISYPAAFRGNNGEDDIEEPYEEYIDLLSFDDTWTRRKYLKLLSIEFKYRIDSFIHHREHLDLLGPYLFALLASLSFIVPWENINEWFKSI